MHIRQLIGVLLVASLLAACGATPTVSPSARPTPTPTPGDLSAVQAALALRGVTIQQVVSGDTGCPLVPDLHRNAARFDISLAGDAQPYQVFLFRWRRPADFAAAEQPFSACVDEYTESVAGDVSIDSVEIEPWRAYGPAWSDDLIQVLEQSLRDVRGD